jgi:hypothetical protein
VKRVGRERLERWGMKLTCRPHASEGEGRKGGGSRMGLGPRGERGRRGVGWASRAEKEGNKVSFLIFLNQFSNAFIIRILNKFLFA